MANIRTVKVTNPGTNVQREYTCEQWALMNGVPPSGWEVVSNTCKVYLQNFYAPFASFTPEFGGDGGITVTSGEPVIYEAIIGASVSDRVFVPLSELQLPSNPARVRVEVRRQAYRPSDSGHVRDFYVNTVDNSIDFVVAAGKPSLNTYLASIWVLKP